MQGKVFVPLSPHLLHGGGVYLIHGLVQSCCGLIVISMATSSSRYYIIRAFEGAHIRDEDDNEK